MSTPLASFFTKIGFEVDKSSLVALEKNLSRLETRIKSMASSFSGMSNSQHIKAASRLANAEAKRINAEVGLTRQKMGLAKVEAGVEKAKQLTQKEFLKLQQKKETTAGHYAKVNSASLLGNTKVKTAQDIAALKEALGSSTSKLRLNEASEKARIATQLMNAKAEAELLRRKSMTEADLARKNATAANIRLSTSRIEAQAALARVRNTGREIQNRVRGGSSSSNPTGGAVDPLFTMQNFKSVLALDTARRFAMQSFNVGNFQISQQPQYEFLTGSASGAQEQIKFVDKEVERLSLNLQAANSQYRMLLASAGKPLGIEQTQKLFSNFQNLSTMMGLSTDQQNRGIRAFSQMASKGQVMAEELNFRLAA